MCEEIKIETLKSRKKNYEQNFLRIFSYSIYLVGLGIEKERNETKLTYYVEIFFSFAILSVSLIKREEYQTSKNEWMQMKRSSFYQNDKTILFFSHSYLILF